MTLIWKQFKATLVGAVVVALAACGGSTQGPTASSPSAPPAAPGVAPDSGSWGGTTSESLLLSFDVNGSTLSNLTIGLMLSQNNGPLQAYRCDGDGKTATISGGRFTIQAVCIRAGTIPLVSVPVSGAFTTASAASGTVSSSTWQATRR